MRNSTAISVGVPAPFETLAELSHYLRLLQDVVDNPTHESVEAYAAYDEDVFTPVVVTSLYYRYAHPVSYRSCILYDGVQYSFDKGGDIRNSARVAINSLVSYVASSGAFPAHLMSEVFAMLDKTLVDIVGDDSGRLEFARKRMRLQLLNVWIEDTRWRKLHLHTGDPGETLQNVALGWKQFGAPFGAPWIAKLVASVENRRSY